MLSMERMLPLGNMGVAKYINSAQRCPKYIASNSSLNSAPNGAMLKSLHIAANALGVNRKR